MALQMGALRSALLEAGATEDMANKAAEEIAGYYIRFGKASSDLRIVKWMVVFLLVGGLILLFTASHR